MLFNVSSVYPCTRLYAQKCMDVMEEEEEANDPPMDTRLYAQKSLMCC
jgi:hypothetical protein